MSAFIFEVAVVVSTSDVAAQFHCRNGGSTGGLAVTEGVVFSRSRSQSLIAKVRKEEAEGEKGKRVAYRNSLLEAWSLVRARIGLNGLLIKISGVVALPSTAVKTVIITWLTQEKGTKNGYMKQKDS